MTFNLTEILTRHKNIEQSPGTLPLKKQLEIDFSKFFLKSLESLSPGESDVAELQNFLTQNFNLFAHSIFSVFSRPNSLETQTLIEIASYCSRNTGKPACEFLLPGVAFSEQQTSSDLKELLQGHILSSCSTQLISSNCLLFPAEAELTIEDLPQLQNHSIEQKFLHELYRLEQAPFKGLMVFIGRVEELIMALQDHETAYERVLDFNTYYKIGISTELRQFISASMHNSIVELLEYLLDGFKKKQLGNGLFIINPDLLANFLKSYNEQSAYLKQHAGISRSTIAPAILPPFETVNVLREKLLKKDHTNRLYGRITAELLQTINTDFKIRSATDLWVLEHIPPSEFSKIITSDFQRLPFQVSSADIMQRVTRRSLLLLLSELTPSQLEHFCQNIPEPLWVNLLGCFEGFCCLLWFFHNDLHYPEALIFGMAHALPALIEKSLSQEMTLKKLFDSNMPTKEIQKVMENALITKMELFHKKLYFHPFLALSNVAKKLSTEYWIASFQKNERNMSMLLPSLHPQTKKNIFKILIPLIATQKIILRDLNSLLVCVQELRPLQLHSEYRSLTELFNTKSGQQKLCQLLRATKNHHKLHELLYLILQKIYGCKPDSFSSFFQEALRHPHTSELLLKADIMPSIIAFLQKNCHQALGLLFDELYTATLSFPTDEVRHWNPQIFKYWLEYEQHHSIDYRNIRTLVPSSLELFYNNTHERMVLLLLLGNHDLVNLGLLDYQQFLLEDFISLPAKIQQEDSFSPNYFLLTLSSIGVVVAAYSPEQYYLFFTHTLMRSISTSPHLFTELSAPILKELLSYMSPSERTTFVFALVTSSEFPKMEPSVIALLFSSMDANTRTDANIINAIGSLDESVRAQCFKTLTDLNVTLDRCMIFNMQDLYNYLTANSKLTSNFSSELIREFFLEPAQVRHLIKAPSDWIIWLKMGRESSINTAFLKLLMTDLLTILPIVGERFFREIFVKLTEEHLLEALQKGNYSIEFLIEALIKLGCPHSKFLIYIKKITGQDCSLSTHIGLILQALKNSGQLQKYSWLLYFIKTHLHETAVNILNPRFKANSFSIAIAGITPDELEEILNSNPGHESLAISILIKLGLTYKSTAYIIYKLPTINYIAIWEDFEKKLPANEFNESFYALHETLQVYQIQNIVRSIYQTQNIPLYVKFFPRLHNAAQIFVNDELFLSYFTDRESVLCLINSSTISLEFRDAMARELFVASNRDTIEKIKLTAADRRQCLQKLTQKGCHEKEPILATNPPVLFTSGAEVSGYNQSGFISAATSYASTDSGILYYSQSETESSPDHTDAASSKKASSTPHPLQIKRHNP